MNKIYSDQIAKAENLVKGIAGNAAELQGRGITTDTSKIEATYKDLIEASEKQEAAQTALNECRDRAHELLAELKELYTSAKDPIKQAYPLEQWAKFGLPDKR